jgi:hypothetical protein
MHFFQKSLTTKNRSFLREKVYNQRINGRDFPEIDEDKTEDLKKIHFESKLTI